MCGGTKFSHNAPGLRRGLSPRVRGNRRRREFVALAGGSIPACAGEPAPATRSRGRTTVYPRVCGGTRHSAERWLWPEGLSPRVRGNPAIRCDGKIGRGSIPACAGEPAMRYGGAGQQEVYPRVCGGTYIGHCTVRLASGLSPRVRGNLRHRWSPSRVRGSIPACAGEPWRPGSRGGGCSVYPRVCGGTLGIVGLLRA